MKENGTERPFTGEYDKHFRDGVYNCAECGKKLFTSESKFNSGCGWPAFSKEIKDANIILFADTDLLSDNTWISEQDMFGRNSITPIADNGRMVVNSIEDWEDKIKNIIHETKDCDLRLIGGIPPWVIMYFEKLLI